MDSSPWTTQSCQELLLARKLRNNALIFGYILLFPSVPTIPLPCPLLPIPTWQDKLGITSGYMEIFILYAYYSFCFFSLIKPFLQCAFCQYYYHRWLPEDETNLKFSGDLGIKAFRWKAGLGISRPGLLLWLFNCCWPCLYQLISVSFNMQCIYFYFYFWWSQDGGMRAMYFYWVTSGTLRKFTPLPHFEKDLSN